MLPTEQISHQVHLVGSRNTAKKIISSHNREQHTTVKYSTFYCLLSTFGSLYEGSSGLVSHNKISQNITEQNSIGQNTNYLLRINLFERLYKQKL